MLRWVGWTLVRIIVTLACVYTLFNVVHMEGYYISFNPLLIGAIILIIMIRLWSSSNRENRLNGG
jgi:hypothetical protein